MASRLQLRSRVALWSILVGLAGAQTLRTLWRRWLDPSGRQFPLTFERYGLARRHPRAVPGFTESIVAD